MVIEHTFITTLEAEAAMSAASAFLAARGFRVEPQTAFIPVTAGGPSHTRAMELTRGVANPVRAKGVGDLPQRVRLEWDRGRVSVAASITPKNDKQVRHTPYLQGPESADLVKLPAVNVMACILLTVTRVLESLLAAQDGAAAAATWALLDDGLARRVAARKLQARRSRNRIFVLLGILVALIVGLVLWGNLSGR
jgi:hypothetical protein